MARNFLRKWKWFVANQRTRKEDTLHGLPDAALRLELWVLGKRGGAERHARMLRAGLGARVQAPSRAQSARPVVSSVLSSEF